MNSQFQVLTVGELNVDLILNKIAGYPEIGKEKLSEQMVFTLGSSSAIFASNLSSLGMRVGFLGKVGNDRFGELVKDSLNAKGVDTTFLMVEEATGTGVTVVLNYSEDRMMVTFPGAMEHLKLEDITEEKLKTAQHLHFASVFLQKGIREDIIELFSKAKACGLTTSLDPQWDPEEKWALDYENLLPYVDVFLPNEKELLLITKSNSIEEAMSKIEKYSNHVVVKLGSNGSVLYEKSGAINPQPSFTNKEVVDAIGAGDSFNAGFISKFVQGAPLAECQVFGNLTGAINTTASGGTTAFSSKQHIMTIANQRFQETIEL